MGRVYDFKPKGDEILRQGKEYSTCMNRGHAPDSRFTVEDGVEWYTCMYCRTEYSIQQRPTLIERKTPGERAGDEFRGWWEEDPVC